MTNHFNIIVETPKPTLVAGMKWFLGNLHGAFSKRRKGAASGDWMGSASVSGAAFRALAEHSELTAGAQSTTREGACAPSDISWG